MMTYLISLAPSRLVQLSPKQQNRIDKIPSLILLEASVGQSRLFHRLLMMGGVPMEAPVPRPPFRKAMTFQFYFVYCDSTYLVITTAITNSRVVELTRHAPTKPELKTYLENQIRFTNPII